MLNTKNRDDLLAIYEKEIANKLPIDTNLFEFEIILADHRYRWIVSGCVSISDLFPIYTYGSYQPSQERRNLFRINRHQLSTDYQFYLVWLITSHYVFLLDLLFSIAIGFRKQNLFLSRLAFFFFIRSRLFTSTKNVCLTAGETKKKKNMQHLRRMDKRIWNISTAPKWWREKIKLRSLCSRVKKHWL